MRTRALFASVLIAGFLRAQAPHSGWTTADQERFLLTARIESEEPAGKGLNKTLKVMLSDGRRSHAAHLQTIDIYMPLFKGQDGSQEKDFKDTWKFNVAAWRLAELLHLEYMTPPCVARTADGKTGAMCWWVDDVVMDEKQRLAKIIQPPDVYAWNRQMDTIRIFDQLIYNMDRSQENLLIDRDWRVWMIDHTRAFRKWHTLRNPAAVTRCSPELLHALQTLRRDDVARELSPFLTIEELDGLMARRDIIVEKLIGQPAQSTASRRQ
jgi:hypothetical protein